MRSDLDVFEGLEDLDFVLVGVPVRDLDRVGLDARLD